MRRKGFPVIHIQHASANPDSPLSEKNPGHNFKDEVLPLGSETIIKKSVNSAFIGTNLYEKLRGNGIKQLVIAGLTTDHCVSTTTRMAGNFGFEVFVVSDATAAFGKGIDGIDFSAETIHQVSLATLDGEFAKVIITPEVLKRFN